MQFPVNCNLQALRISRYQILKGAAEVKRGRGNEAFKCSEYPEKYKMDTAGERSLLYGQKIREKK